MGRNGLKFKLGITAASLIIFDLSKSIAVETSSSIALFLSYFATEPTYNLFCLF